MGILRPHLDGEQAAMGGSVLVREFPVEDRTRTLYRHALGAAGLRVSSVPTPSELTRFNGRIDSSSVECQFPK